MITGPEPGITRDAVATDFLWGGRPVRLFDTAGLRRKARISEKAEKLSASDAVRAIRFAEVVVVLIDAQNPLEHQDLTIADMVEQEGRALVLAVNKWDLVAEKQKTLKELREKLDVSAGAAAGRAAGDAVGAGGPGAAEARGRGVRQLRALEPARADAGAQPLAGRGAGAPHGAGGQGTPHQDPLHDAALGAAADVRGVLLAPRGAAQGLPALPHQQPARDVRPAGRADPLQAAQGG